MVELAKSIEVRLNEEMDCFIDSISAMLAEEVEPQKDELDKFFNSLVIAKSLTKSLLEELIEGILKPYGVKVIFPNEKPNETIKPLEKELLDSFLSELNKFLSDRSDKN